MFNTRRFRNVNWCKLRRYFLCKLFIFLVALVVVTTFWLIINNNAFGVFVQRADNNNFAHCQPIDVVYTWVNGNDSEFIRSAQLYNMYYDVARFDDKNELRYSLRSLEKYAPWIRHVYIVTNGQIPYWLDLSYEKVTIIPHELLAPHAGMLPTFSSATIETFLHRIPQLSERFLYLNDDIFLGAPLYLEDLYTESEGVQVYQAWMVPDCATDCPWTYIADGACDAHCNIAECQYDGDDCATIDSSTLTSEISQVKINKPHNDEFSEVRSFRELLNKRNITGLKDSKRLANNYNKEQLNKQHYHNNTYNNNNNNNNNNKQQGVTSSTANSKINSNSSSKSTSKDIYSQSLIYTNMILNRVYGFKARNVLAHVGFLLQRSIIDAMQKKFTDAINLTRQHRFRASNDLQFAFVYYTFLMSETHLATLSDIFDEFDTDSSGTWSDREVRTVLSRLYTLPLDWSGMRYFEDVINNCTRKSNQQQEHNIVYPTLVYERYEDSNLPTITKELVLQCTRLAEALIDNFGIRQQYKYKLNNRRNTPSNFMMLTSNITEVVDSLDAFRKHPRKFNCINDNLVAQHKEDNELIRQLLEDFYLSFFPKRSKFELAPQYRNRFTNWWDYLRWRRRKRAVLVCAYTAAFLLLAFLFRLLCLHKAKIVRRCVQKL